MFSITGGSVRNPKAAASTSKKDECKCKSFQNPLLILGLIVWAILLTIMVIVIIFIAARNVRKEQEEQFENSMAYSQAYSTY